MPTRTESNPPEPEPDLGTHTFTVTPPPHQPVAPQLPVYSAPHSAAGPLYQKYNTVLRCFSGDAFVVSLCVKLGLGERLAGSDAEGEGVAVEDRPPAKNWKWINSYQTTIHAINSCVLKASKLTKAGKVWRGFSRATLPESFWVPDEQGICGGIEFGFSSTTTEMRQALHYASGAASTVFEMRMGMVDRGASLRWLSQYPHENEILFAPLLGQEALRSRVQGQVLLVETALSCNMNSLTLEQVVSKRRKVCVDMLASMQEELGHELRSQEQWAAPAWFPRLQDEARGALSKVRSQLLRTDAALYNDDDFLASTVKGVVDARRAISRWPDELAILASVAVQEQAKRAVMVLNKADMTEMKELFHPPAAVRLVMECVRTILSDEPKLDMSWKASLNFIRSGRVLREMVYYDIERTPLHLTKALSYLDLEQFHVEAIANTCKAAKALCIWCRFILVIQRMKQWLKPKELELEERRELSKEVERQTYEQMHSHSDIRPVACARREEVENEGPVERRDEHGQLVAMEYNLPELPLIKAAEVSTLADIDREIVQLLRLDDASATRSRQVISKFGKSRRTLLRSLGSRAHVEGTNKAGP